MYNSKGVSSQLNVSPIDIICLDLDLTTLCFFLITFMNIVHRGSNLCL